jgi:hypothetical protein
MPKTVVIGSSGGLEVAVQHFEKKNVRLPQNEQGLARGLNDLRRLADRANFRHKTPNVLKVV